MEYPPEQEIPPIQEIIFAEIKISQFSKITLSDDNNREGRMSENMRHVYDEGFSSLDLQTFKDIGILSTEPFAEGDDYPETAHYYASKILKQTFPMLSEDNRLEVMAENLIPCLVVIEDSNEEKLAITVKLNSYAIELFPDQTPERGMDLPVDTRNIDMANVGIMINSEKPIIPVLISDNPNSIEFLNNLKIFSGILTLINDFTIGEFYQNNEGELLDIFEQIINNEDLEDREKIREIFIWGHKLSGLGHSYSSLGDPRNFFEEDFNRLAKSFKYFANNINETKVTEILNTVKNILDDKDSIMIENKRFELNGPTEEELRKFNTF